MRHYLNPLVCILYLTTLCGGKCRQCRVRSNVKHPYNPATFAVYETVIRRIRECKNLGVKFIELTGGDPLLMDWLPEVLALCNELGLLTILSVSGPMIVKRLQDWGEEWIKLPWLLRFSIDGGETYHNSNRGEGFYETILVGLEVAKRIRPYGMTQLVFTLMPGSEGNMNRDQFALVFQLAKESSVEVNLNPLFGTEFTGTLEQTNLSDQEKRDLHWLTRQEQIMEQSLAKIDFLLSGGNDLLLPTCCAAEAVVTISANDCLIAPCYTSQYSIIPIGAKGLEAALKSRERFECLGQSGKYFFCEGCMVWCNIGPSKAYSLSDPALQRLVISGT